MTMKRNRFGKKVYEELAKSAGGVLTEDKHLLIEENGEIVEKKLCTNCLRWEPLMYFAKHSKAKDGLQPQCRECVANLRERRTLDDLYAEMINSESNKSDIVEEKSEKIKQVVVEKVVEVEKPTTAKDAFSVIMAEYEAKNKEIERLKSELEKEKNSKDLSNLSEREIKYVLENNKIVPRLLVEALSRYDDRYVFSAYDKVTGLTSTIRVEPQTA